MARIHLPKRTIVPRYTKEDEALANGEVKTYLASDKDLAYFHSLFKPRVNAESGPYYLKKNS